MRTFKVILITGGIGAGKSEAARHIASCGIPVYDSDSSVKMLYDNDIQLVENLESALGTSLRDAEGKLDRKILAGQIFSSSEKLQICESIVHPAVMEDFRQWASGQDTNIVCMESAIALSRPLFDGFFDWSIYINADQDVRISRASARDGSDRSSVAARINSQPDFSWKADYVIENNNGKQELHDRIDSILEEIRFHSNIDVNNNNRK